MKNKKNYPWYDVEEVKSIKHLLENAVEKAGDKDAFRYKEDGKIKNVTYAEFQQDTMELGEALVDIGMGGAHISIIGDNSYNWINVYLTVLKSAGVAVPIDKELPFQDIVNVANSGDSEVLFYASKYEKNLMENQDKFPKIKYFIGFDRKEDEGKFLSFKKFKEKGKKLLESGSNEYNKLSNDEYALKLLVYTSGTTGIAKGVMLSEHNLISCVYYGLQVATIYDSCLSVLPYHHTYEGVAGILVALHHHSTICINESLKTVQKNMQLYKPEYIYLVPAFAEVFYKKIWTTAKQTGKEGGLKLLIKVSNGLRKVGIDVRRKLFKSVLEAFGGELKEIVCGGAPLRAELGTFFDSIGIDLINGYGITECSPLVSVNREMFNDPATVGPILPCCEVKFENVNEDGDGEICVKGDIVMMGYYKNPEQTAEVLKDGWFNTGDFGRMTDKGQLVITGRKKNLIVLENGKNVFPEEIENYLSGIPYVADVVVYGIKDENGSEIGLCAEAFLNQEKLAEMQVEDVKEMFKKDVLEACEPLPMYKKISKTVIREEPFEKTTTNKIKRQNLGK